MPYGSGSYGAVAYAGGVGAPPWTDLKTWDADLSQRLNVDLILIVGLQVPPAVIPPPAVFSSTGPTGPTGLTGPTGPIP